MPKPTPKTYPVCTIRSTPSQPIHCIVWAKSYLMPLVCLCCFAILCAVQVLTSLISQLFGEDEDSGNENELDEAEKQGENGKEDILPRLLE